MSKINAVVEKRPAPIVPTGTVTLAEIEAVKRAWILLNLSLSPKEAGALFGRSARWALGKIKDGIFTALDGDARTGENGLQASRYVRITAESVAAYRASIAIDPQRWGE